MVGATTARRRVWRRCPSSGGGLATPRPRPRAAEAKETVTGPAPGQTANWRTGEIRLSSTGEENCESFQKSRAVRAFTLSLDEHRSQELLGIKVCNLCRSLKSFLQPSVIRVKNSLSIALFTYYNICSPGLGVTSARRHRPHEGSSNSEDSPSNLTPTPVLTETVWWEK